MYPRRSDISDDPYFSGVRCVGIALTLCVVAVHVMLKAVFFSPAFLREIAIPIESASQGLITPATLAGGLEMVVIVAGVMMIAGKLRSRDLGLHGALVPTVVGVGAIWMIAHVLSLAGAGLAGQPVQWISVSAVPMLGSFLEAIVGSAAVEEIIYRGFLLVQVYLVIKLVVRTRPAVAFVGAVTLVQGYFAVSHIPAGLRMGLDGFMLTLYIVQVGLVGVILAMLYLRTRSLVIPIGAHALLNAPVLVAGGPVDVGVVLMILVCISVFLLLGEKKRYLMPAPAAAPPSFGRNQ